MPQEPTIHSSYEKKTGTWQYVVADPSTLKAVIIDSVLDYDPSTQTISTETAECLLSMISDKGYKIEKILETHAHADHLTAASYLQNRLEREQGFKAPICIGKRITQVQDMFGQRYGVPADEYKGVFDKFFDDEESFEIGNLTATVTHLPGHTPDHIGYIIGENVFCGDSLFHTDIGTARADFPGGSASSLYNSGRKLLQLPGHYKIWLGHDYPSVERGTPVDCLSVRDHKERNKHLANNTTQEEFVSMREARDATLAAPKLLHPSLQMNIRAGRLPISTPMGLRFLHLPLKFKGAEWGA
ncbi:putative metallo-beta-lactamase domain protein [Lophiotrema nucula]|uniref:Putative metallo-beta-lactamase domain protein n=1 Tax=Lophiotrema nucula TaxID=690887 RepID=A0A6A5ZVH9_9PLEO|nr:putative metallo-beta-lactamase domain protein [Lophiotrema nucula]